MSVFAAVQNGDMDSAATFGGSGTPGNGDEIVLGGYTVSCSSDKRALASGITVSGTGKLLIKSGGAFKTAAGLPATCTLQFGEPEGEGDGPLPPVGSLDSNASGELVLNAAVSVNGPCKVYTVRRSGKGWGIVTGVASASESVLDEATTDWLTGDVMVPVGKTYVYEYLVTGWNPETRTLAHSAVASGYNAVGTPLVRMSCAATIRRVVSSGSAVLQAGVEGSGDLYCYSVSGGATAVAGKINLRGRLACNTRGGATPSNNALATCHGSVDQIVALDNLLTGTSAGISVHGGIFNKLLLTYVSAICVIEGGQLLSAITPPYAGNIFDATLVDVALPTPLIAGSLTGVQRLRVLSSDGQTDTLYTEGGITTLVQHEALPGVNDLPAAYLLAPVSGRAISDRFITVRRGQSVRIRFHAWPSSSAASCGYEIYDDARAGDIAAGRPLQAFTLPGDAEILEWHRPTPEVFYNDTPRDMLLRVRAWATGDNCYIRLQPEQGGGEL